MRGGFHTRSDGQFVAQSPKAAQNEIPKQDITDTAASKGATAGQSSSTIPSISLPPLEFEYNQAVIQDKITKIDAEGMENLPISLYGSLYQWIDLDGAPGLRYGKWSAPIIEIKERENNGRYKSKGMHPHKL